MEKTIILMEALPAGKRSSKLMENSKQKTVNSKKK